MVLKNGKRHRDNDLPAIEYKDGSREWYQDGKLHRIGGPAYEDIDGTKYWYYYNMPHRLDGPAIENKDGTKYWYKYGIEQKKIY